MGRGGARPGSGRKPLSDKPMVNRSVNLSLPEENWPLLDRYLERNNLDLAAYLRTLVMNDILFTEEFHTKRGDKR